MINNYELKQHPDPAVKPRDDGVVVLSIKTAHNTNQPSDKKFQDHKKWR